VGEITVAQQTFKHLLALNLIAQPPLKRHRAWQQQWSACVLSANRGQLPICLYSQLSKECVCLRWMRPLDMTTLDREKGHIYGLHLGFMLRFKGLVPRGINRNMKHWMDTLRGHVYPSSFALNTNTFKQRVARNQHH
jgi:hypothetical protein